MTYSLDLKFGLIALTLAVLGFLTDSVTITVVGLVLGALTAGIRWGIDSARAPSPPQDPETTSADGISYRP
jgi:acyl dehydratase